MRAGGRPKKPLAAKQRDALAKPINMVLMHIARVDVAAPQQQVSRVSSRVPGGTTVITYPVAGLARPHKAYPGTPWVAPMVCLPARHLPVWALAQSACC